MKNDFASLRSWLKRPTATSDELDSVVAAAKAYSASVLAALEVLEDKRVPMLSESDATRTKYRDELIEAREHAHDAELLVEALTSRYSETRDAEEEAARRERFAEVVAEMKQFEKALLAYPVLAKQIRDLIERSARLKLAVDQINADLPAGAHPLREPEQVVRGRPGWSGKTLATSEVESWCLDGSDQPLNPEAAGRVENYGNGRGFLRGPETTYGSPGNNVVKRRFRRIDFVPDVSHDWIDSLAKTVVLPRFRIGEPEIFEPRQFSDARSTLTAIERIKTVENTATKTTSQSNPEPQVRFELLDDDVSSSGATSSVE